MLSGWLGWSPGFRHALACVALAVLTAGAFSNALYGEFVNFDDWYLVEQNEHIRSLGPGNVLDVLLRPSAQGAWLPLRVLSYAVDYQFWGLHAFGYHLTNVVLHAANVLLVYAVLNWLLGSGVLALLGAAWFAVHPVQVESVAWVSGRRDVLYAFFFLLSFLAFLGYERRRGRGRWVLYGASLACLGLSLLSKAAGMMQPAVLLLAVLCDPSGPPRSGGLGGRLWALAPFVALAAAGTAVHYAVAHEAGIVKGQLFGTRLASVPWIFASYWRLLFFPVHLATPQARVPLGWGEAEWMVGQAVVVVAVVAIAWRSAPKRGLALFCLGWWLLLLAPVSNLVPLAMLIAERYLYLPLVGACGFAASLVGSLAARWKWPVAACAVAVLGLFTVATHHRNRAWADSKDFWEDGVSKWPAAPVPRIGLADAYLTADRPDLAWEQDMKVALSSGIAWSQNPEHVKLVHTGMRLCYDRAARLFEAEGRMAEALQVYRTVVRLMPDDVKMRVSLAEAYERRGMVAEALEQVRAVRKLDPTYPGLEEWLQRLRRAGVR